MEKAFVCIICGRGVPENCREHENTDWCAGCLDLERMRNGEAHTASGITFSTNLPNYIRYPQQIPPSVREEILSFGNGAGLH